MVICDDIAHACSGPDGMCIKIACCGAWSLILSILAIILIACSVETIDSTEMGIAYNAPQAILSDQAKEEGLHSKPPFGYFILWPRTHQTLHQSVTGMSSDGVITKLDIAFQYKIEETALNELTLNYKDFTYYHHILGLKSRSGIRNACMLFKAQEFQTARAAVQAKMFDELKKRLTGGDMKALVLDLQLTSVDRPKQYEKAVDNKENARNAISLSQNQRAQLIVQANTKLAKVTVEANKTMDSARTAAAVTTKAAEARAAIVYGQYESQGKLYNAVRTTRGLSSEGLLAYMGTRLIDELSGITVGLDAPARVAYTLTNTTVRM